MQRRKDGLTHFTMYSVEIRTHLAHNNKLHKYGWIPIKIGLLEGIWSLKGGTVKLITWIASSRKPHYDTLISSTVYYILGNYTKVRVGRTTTQLHMNIYRSPEAKINKRLWTNACCQVATYTNFISQALIEICLFYTLWRSTKLTHVIYITTLQLTVW